MKELFRERDYTRVGYYQSILEAAGIPTHVRNQDLVTMTTEVPIPEFFPALCVVNDEDYESALGILREQAATEEAEREANPEAPAAPFEMRGVVLAGIVVIFGMLLLGGLLGLATVLQEVFPGETRSGGLTEAELEQFGLTTHRGFPFLELVLTGGVTVVAFFAIVFAIRSYLATCRRRKSAAASAESD